MLATACPVFELRFPFVSFFILRVFGSLSFRFRFVFMLNPIVFSSFRLAFRFVLRKQCVN